jgi:hypothetical protein
MQGCSCAVKNAVKTAKNTSTGVSLKTAASQPDAFQFSARLGDADKELFVFG